MSLVLPVFDGWIIISAIAYTRGIQILMIYLFDVIYLRWAAATCHRLNPYLSWRSPGVPWFIQVQAASSIPMVQLHTLCSSSLSGNALFQVSSKLSLLIQLIHGFHPMSIIPKWLGSPAHASHGCAAGGAGSSFPTVSTPSGGAAAAAGAAGSGFSWHCGYFRKSIRGRNARVVFVSILFVGLSVQSGCFSGCSP